MDEQAGTISVSGVVEEARFHFHKLRLTAQVTTKFNSTTLDVNDAVENFGGTSTTMQMLYHINIGEPLLDAGSKLAAPAAKVVPRNVHAAADIDNYATYAGPTPRLRGAGLLRGADCWTRTG